MKDRRFYRSGAIGLLTGLVVCWAMLAAGTTARAQDVARGDGHVMLVLDGSGSMWAKLGTDNNKAYIVRDALKPRLNAFGRTKVGLATFGYRRAGDCSDAHVAFEPDGDVAERLTPFLEKFNPRGKGPLAEGLKVAGDALKAKPAPRSMIVIGDNADNCRTDVCDVGKALKAEMPDLVMHVVGLGVPASEFREMSCLAELSGGQARNAQSFADVEAALDAIVGRAGQAKPPAAALARPRVTASDPLPKKSGVKLSAVLGKGGAPILSGMRWRIVDTSSKQVYDGSEPSPWVELPAGRYKVSAQFGFAQAEADLEIASDAPVKLSIAVEAGVVRVASRASALPPSTDRPFYTLYALPSGAENTPRALALTSDTAPVFNLPPGKYQVSVQQGLARLDTPVAVKAGEIVDVDIPLYLGEVRLAAVAEKGGKPLDEMFFAILEDDPEAAGGLREVARSGASTPRFSLPAGSYHVVARRGSAEVRDRFSVKPGSTSEYVLIVPAGELAFSSAQPGGSIDPKLLSYRVFRIETGAQNALKEVAFSSAPSGALQLAAGRYRVESIYGVVNARSVRDVEIKAGQRQEVVLEHAAGQVELHLVAPGGDRTIRDVFWDIVDERGKVVWTTGQSAPVLVLQAGRYTARAEHRDGSQETVFAVSGGDRKTVEVVIR